MVAATLVDENIRDGRRLLDQLHRDGLEIDAALWLYSSEEDDWTLILASDQLLEQGPKHAYERLQAEIAALSPPASFRLTSVSVRRSGHPLIRAVRTGVWFGDAEPGTRVHRSVVGREFIEDAYVYRLP